MRFSTQCCNGRAPTPAFGRAATAGSYRAGLVTRPALLLAAEPTGNLDSHASEEILTLFTRLNDKGIAMVLVTHEPDIAAHAGQQLVIRDGQLASDSQAAAPVEAGVLQEKTP